MKRKMLLSSLFISLWLITGCGNENTLQKKAVMGKKQENTIPDKPAISFMMDGKLIESTDYSCSWMLKGKLNIFNFTVHYDREPKNVPPHVGFNIYNLKDINLPLSRLNGKLPSSEQSFSLNFSFGFPKGKALDMNELSYSDNYKGLSSQVQLSLLDTVAKIVSGRFEGTVQNANGKSVVISEGKFDRVTLKMIY